MPVLPPGYVVRDELDGIVAAVVRTEGSGAVGVTAEPAGVGLHGLGGIGKSVLAAALATDDRIRRRFPDGVFWAAVGEHPDLLALHLDLLARLGAGGTARTVEEATEALRSHLAERRVLLVVDDVWTADAARAFRVTGARGRLLYTSRDEGVVTAAGAAPHRVGVLDATAARRLAGEVLRTPGVTLPEAAGRAFAEVGHVPLAVALLAAAVRGGRSWDEVVADLDCDTEVYGAHPYANTFRALHVGASALPDDLRAALFGLAVFPPDTAVPVAAIERYWARTRSRSAEETADDLARLAAANLLYRDAGTVGFHDLAHDYLLLHADALPALHAQLLDAYRGLLDEPNQWWQLPVDEPYVWEHLAVHLAGAGDHRTLVAAVTDPAYQARRIPRDGPHAGAADLTVAARLVPDEPTVRWWRAWLARHAHLLGTPSAPDRREAGPVQVAGTMHAWLEADPSFPAEVRPDRLAPLLPRPYLAVRGGLSTESSALVRVLTGHAGGVNAVASSPDGTRLATAGADGTVRIWDPVTGTTTATLTGHTNTVWAVAWSPDGTRLATAGADRTLELRDVRTGSAARSLTGHTDWVRAAAWAPDGRLVATAGDDRTVRLWKCGTSRWLGRPTARTVLTLTGHTDWIYAVAWSPDGTRVATAGRDRTVRLWDPTTGVSTVTLTGHAGVVRAVAWSPDGTRLASTGVDRTLHLWDPASKEPVCTRNTGHATLVHSVAWSLDGAHLATADTTGLVIIWDRHAREVTSLQLQPSECLAWSAPLIAVGQRERPAILALRDPGDL